MKTYEFEIVDGLADALKHNSVALHAQIVKSPTKVSKDVNISDELKEAVASLEEDDLFPITSVLVSDGWNLNDDVFTASDLWDAKDTPINKPINIQHVSADVIGHMTESRMVTQDGIVIASQSDLTKDIDIIVGGVIYRSWTDKEQREIVAKLINAIERNEKFVSMECHFSAFDYAILTPEGEHKYIERTSESAFLTKHLRAYGGTGEYEGYRVGRLLRNYRFIGKGIVDVPGNPRSVILASSKTFEPVKASQFFTCAEVKMDQKDLDVANAEIARLKAELASAEKAGEIQAELDAVKAELDTVKAEKTTLATELETVKSELDGAKTELEAVTADKTSLTESLTKVTEERDNLTAEIRDAKRTGALKAKNLSDEEITSVMASFKDANDDMFEAAVALIKTEEKSECKDKEAKAEDKMKDEDEDEKEMKKDAKADLDASDLDNVKDESTADLTNPSTSDSLVSYASAYFQDILKLTPKKEEK